MLCVIHHLYLYNIKNIRRGVYKTDGINTMTGYLIAGITIFLFIIILDNAS